MSEVVKTGLITKQTLSNTLDKLEGRKGALEVIKNNFLSLPKLDEVLEIYDELDVLTQTQFDHEMYKKAN